MIKSQIKLLATIIVFFLINTILKADCNFNTAEKIFFLNKPNSIKRIEIKVNKSRKFSKNFAKIISSRTENIPPKLKKKFKADITVVYAFGKCNYNANIKQIGNWKDHVQLNKDGKYFRSLSVKLKNGNIQNAVKFKLYIPETRNNLNEVLGTIIARELGFISPETFQVKVNINGTEETMLFQEDVRKELLERNLRREGPTFEGDESILWSYGIWENFSLLPIALARITNSNWFLKGKQSQDITLKAFSNLQKAYIETPNKYFINPNKKSSQIFEDYFFLMLSMNGIHGLTGHNRKFYFNAITEKFEPIYNDGNLLFQKKIRMDSSTKKILDLAFHKKYKFPFSQELNNKTFISNIRKKFYARIISESDHDKNNFFKKNFTIFQYNLDYLQKKINKRKNYPIYKDHNLKNNKNYLKKVIKIGVVQDHIFNIEKINLNYKITFENSTNKIVNAIELNELLAKNVLKDKRTIFIPSIEILTKYKNNSFTYKDNFFAGSVTYSDGITIDKDKENKKITITQSKPKDWILFNNIILNDWLVDFKGAIPNIEEEYNQQRFNKNGLTGCLNFYKSQFNKTSFFVNNGGCEDSVNIISSKGEINSITIKSAFADAVDVDFSKIKISQINVESAGNDCLDISGGNYEVKTAILINCEDKAISVGEKSDFKSNNLIINSSRIGISTKDFSKASIKNTEITNTEICVESIQKKQEFGGGIAILNKILCDGKYVKDNNSIIRRGS